MGDQRKKRVYGRVACHGPTIEGKIHIIHSVNDLKDFKLNEILVAKYTSPEYLPAMVKSSAIITDEGGVTSHAAIIARELNKPCIVGTSHASHTFNNGDYVKVDTSHSLVETTDRSSQTRS